MAELNYTTISEPYNEFLERTTTDNGANVAIGISGTVGSETTPIESSEQKITSGQSFEDIWINSSIRSNNYKVKTQGFLIDGKAGYIECMKLYVGSGGIVGGKIDIPDTTTANSFHVDVTGNMWIGATTFAAAPGKFSNAGVLTATGAIIDGTSTLGGRIASILASAIDASGNFIDNNLDTSNKYILSDFVFSPSDYSGALKTGTITWNTTTGAITGGTGIVVNKNGIVGALDGVSKFSITTAGDATFAGTLSAAVGTLGSITTALINVGSTGYLLGGQTAYNTGTGFFLGYSTDNYKFSIGNGSTIYQLWTGSTLRSTGMELCQIFTAGETLTAHKFVCFKVGSNSQTNNATQDSYTKESDPTSNHQNEELYIGYVDGVLQDKKREAYVKFDALPANVQTCSFNLINYQDFSADLQISLYTLDADFDESTITWNNAPASTLIAGSAKTITTEGTITWDISSTILGIQRTGGTFYGLAVRVTGGSANNWFRAGSSEVETVSYLSITQEGTNKKAYLADRDSYALSRFVIGKTLEAANADASVTVQVAGIMDNLSFDSTQVGYPAMLTDSGASGMTSLPRIIEKNSRNIELGIVLSTSTILFNINRGSDFYISNETATVSGAAASYTSTVYPPLLARKAMIEYLANTVEGSSQGLLTVYKDSNQIVTVADANGEGTGYTTYLEADWSSVINQIDLSFTADANFSSTPTAIVWYYE